MAHISVRIHGKENKDQLLSRVNLGRLKTLLLEATGKLGASILNSILINGDCTSKSFRCMASRRSHLAAVLLIGGRLYSITSEGWFSYAKAHKRNHHRPIYSRIGSPVSILSQLQRATVYQKRSQWVCSGYADIKCSNPTQYKLSCDFLAVSPPEVKWCLECLDITDDGLYYSKFSKEWYSNHCKCWLL